MNRKLKLVTNYRDWYDHAFDREGIEFRRMNNEGMDRKSMLNFLHSRGFHTPEYGTVKEVVPRLLREYDEILHALAIENLIDVVVHTDINAHAGDGKIKVSAAEALSSYPQHLCVEYIAATPSGNGRSLRYLRVGNRSWWLEYWSESDWRSNVGEGGCRIITEEPSGFVEPRFTDLMFAIDFIPAGRHLYAIDYNIAPGLAPLRDILSPNEVVDLLKG